MKCSNLSLSNDIPFEFSNIPINEINVLFVNFIYVMNPIMRFGSLLLENSNGEYTYENTNITVPIDTVQKDIITLFNLKPWQFKSIKQCNDVACAFIIPNIGDNVKLLIKSMNQLGWVNSIKTKYNFEGKQYINLKFEPLYELDITSEIHQLSNIYHIFPISNHKKIIKNGFIPLNNNKLFDYPKRVYFIKDTVDDETFVNIAYELYKHCGNINKTKYNIYTLSTDKIPKYIKFQNDPYLDHACFTYYKIPYKSVTNVETIDLKDEIFLI